MKRAVTTFVLTTALLVTPLLATPAEASHDSGFSIGGWFAIGGVHFSLVFGSRGYGHPDYYYRTDDRFGYRGHDCTDRCYRDQGYAYHSLDCPVVGYHMDRFHQRPNLLFRGYAPAPYWRGDYYGEAPRRSWDRGGRDRDYDGHARRGRYDRDRYDNRRDRRESHRDRGRRRGQRTHHHDASCGWGRDHHE